MSAQASWDEKQRSGEFSGWLNETQPPVPARLAFPVMEMCTGLKLKRTSHCCMNTPPECNRLNRPLLYLSLFWKLMFYIHQIPMPLYNRAGCRNVHGLGSFHNITQEYTGSRGFEWSIFTVLTSFTTLWTLEVHRWLPGPLCFPHAKRHHVHWLLIMFMSDLWPLWSSHVPRYRTNSCA